jgi:hypothetical protein
MDAFGWWANARAEDAACAQAAYQAALTCAIGRRLPTRTLGPFPTRRTHSTLRSGQSIDRRLPCGALPTGCAVRSVGIAACRPHCGRVALRDRDDGRAAGARGHRRQNGASDDRGSDHAAHISDGRAVERKDSTACLLLGRAACRAELAGTHDNWHVGASLGRNQTRPAAGREASRRDLSTRGGHRRGDRQCTRRGCNCDKPLRIDLARLLLIACSLSRSWMAEAGGLAARPLQGARALWP